MYGSLLVLHPANWKCGRSADKISFILMMPGILKMKFFSMPNGLYSNL